jgi:hypothetical protein
VEMTTCPIHTKFFDYLCPECKKEYGELKGFNEENFRTQTIVSDHVGIDDYDSNRNKDRRYKEFTEERAKKLYGELLLQYLKKSCKEEAAKTARAIIRKQCRLRGVPFWSWTT